MACKAQLTIQNFVDILIWTSIWELAMVIIIILFFFRSPRQMFYSFLHLGHLGRGICGIIIANRIPRTDELIHSLDPASAAHENEDEDAETGQHKQVQFENYRQLVLEKVTALAITALKKVLGLLKLYLIFTIAASIGDGIDFWV
jgi:hypothetical protein